MVDVQTWRNRLISEAGLDKAMADAIARLARPNIRLTVRTDPPDVALPLGASKFGGRPDLPPGESWPHRPPYAPSPFWDHGRGPRSAPLSFLAQINLGDIQAAGGTDLPLPTSGLLSFFYDVEVMPWGFDPVDAPGFRVLYHDSDWIERTSPPDSLAEDWQFSEHALQMDAGESIPTVDSDAVERLLARFPDRKSIRPRFLDALVRFVRSDVFRRPDRREMWSRLFGALEPFASSGHVVGGWPHPVQNAMEGECQYVSNGVYCGSPQDFDSERARELEPGTRDWRLILQLSSDDAAGWMWGDVGNLYFWIRHPDLAHRRFDRVWTILQCG